MMQIVENLKLFCQRHLFDLFLYATALIGITVCNTTDWMSPHNTYVRCDDASISRPPKGDTVSIWTLLVTSLLVPYVMMFLIESWDEYTNPSFDPILTLDLQSTKSGRSFVVGFKMATSYFFGSLMPGNLFSFFVVEILKTSVSEARPHFMSTCEPNFTREMCQQGLIHVTYRNCTSNLRPYYLKDTMKSFPSGHASVAVFTAVFMTMYIQRRIHVKWSKLLVIWLQMVWCTWALYCCASRVWDNRHHWWDVLAGGCLGAVPAYATVIYLSNWFEPSPEIPTEEGSSLSTIRTTKPTKPTTSSNHKQIITTKLNGHSKANQSPMKEQTPLFQEAQDSSSPHLRLDGLKDSM